MSKSGDRRLIIGGIIAGVLIIGTTMYIVSSKKSSDATNKPKRPSTQPLVNSNTGKAVKYTITPIPVGAVAPASASDNFPLKKGVVGPRVKELQQALAYMDYTLAIDGIFGSETEMNLHAQTGRVQINNLDELMQLWADAAAYKADNGEWSNSYNSFK